MKKLTCLLTCWLVSMIFLNPIAIQAEEGAVVQNKDKVNIKDPNLQKFVEAIDAAGLTDVFNGTGPFTAFVPSNAAFEKLGTKKWNELMDPQNKDQLVTILTYHIVPGKYLAKNLKTKSLRTLNGKNIEITVEGEGNIKVNNAKVLRTDLVGPNGVIHEIDTVIFP